MLSESSVNAFDCTELHFKIPLKTVCLCFAYALFLIFSSQHQEENKSHGPCESVRVFCFHLTDIYIRIQMSCEVRREWLCNTSQR